MASRLVIKGGTHEITQRIKTVLHHMVNKTLSIGKKPNKPKGLVSIMISKHWPICKTGTGAEGGFKKRQRKTFYQGLH